jgi:hypothetical protein
VYIYTFVDTDQPAKANRVDNRWHAITIVGPTNACAAAEACRGKRFLSREAPRLPLAECDAKRCDCRYRHYTDRRGPPRRRDDKVGDANSSTAKMRVITANRREKAGRRATDGPAE